MMLIRYPAVLIFIFLSVSTVLCQPIRNYEKYTALGKLKGSGGEVIILRQFGMSDHRFYFAVSPHTLKTVVIRADSILVSTCSWNTLYVKFANSPYIRSLKEADRTSFLLQDAGFTHFKSSNRGIDLTVDLCPSLRPLDRIVFMELMDEIGKTEGPVPVAISITGKWIIRHETDLKWLDSLHRSGKLNIVWINHTFNHFTSKTLPLSKNFMLEPGVDINSEILNLEVALLERHLNPSVFFRFPGLVSNKTIFEEVLSFGLIPVGSDAWLAKGQWPKEGSIVLIHANGNEPLGVRDFIKLLANEKQNVMARQWVLYDLRESVAEDESK
jgi:hypothetical protein